MTPSLPLDDVERLMGEINVRAKAAYGALTLSGTPDPWYPHREDIPWLLQQLAASRSEVARLRAEPSYCDDCGEPFEPDESWGNQAWISCNPCDKKRLAGIKAIEAELAASRSEVEALRGALEVVRGEVLSDDELPDRMTRIDQAVARAIARTALAPKETPR